MSVLLTGFEPWGGVRRNPSGEVASALGGHVLPVDFERAARELRRLIRAERPAAVLMLGLAESRPVINLELVALNVNVRDGGKRRTIVRGGPLALESRLPVERLSRALAAQRIPAKLSHHAGTFVCNHVFYTALRATRVPCGFVHVPPLKAMSLERQIRAVEVMLRALGDGRRAATS